MSVLSKLEAMHEPSTCNVRFDQTGRLLLDSQINEGAKGNGHVLVKAFAIWTPISVGFAALFGIGMLFTIQRFAEYVVWIALVAGAASGLFMAIMNIVAVGSDGEAFSMFILIFVALKLVVLYFLFRKHFTSCGRLMGCAATAI